MPIRPLNRGKKPLVSTKALAWALFWGTLFLIGYAVNVFHLTPERIGAETVHASEVEEIRQNDYYCERIKSGYYPNMGTGKEIAELCAKWGVNLND